MTTLLKRSAIDIKDHDMGINEIEHGRFEAADIEETENWACVS